MEKTQTSTSALILIVLMLFIGLFVFFMYTLLHEGGHALTGWLFGQSLTEFNLNFWNFNAHVGMAGGELSRAQLAVQSAAGASLPLLIWAILISIAPHKATFTLESLKFISSMTVVNTLLAWIMLPVLFLLGKAPSDDVINFLLYSQMPPMLLTVMASILYIGGWVLFLSKTDGLRNELLLFSTTNREKLMTRLVPTIRAMAGIMVFCVILAFTLNSAAEKNSSNRFSPPQDFKPVARIDLLKHAYSSETLAQFTLDGPTTVGVFLSIRSINTTYFDLSVTGPNGFKSTVLHGEGYKAFQDGGLWQKNLPAGTYQIVLTSHQSPGTASIYLKIY